MNNQKLRVLVTAIYVANLNGNKKAESEGALELHEFLKKNPAKISKVKRMIKGLDIRADRYTKELKNGSDTPNRA